jgi:hypothetical protein
MKERETVERGIRGQLVTRFILKFFENCIILFWKEKECEDYLYINM